jgi:hypothetical protein
LIVAEFIKANYYDLCQEMLDFPNLISNLPFVNVSLDTRLCKPTELYDPRQLVFYPLWDPALPNDKYPAKEYQNEEWLEFLEKVGMHTVITPDELVKSCTQFSSHMAEV